MTPEEFKQARRELGLSTAALARILGVEAHTVRRWEMPPHRSSGRPVNPIAARVVTWMLAGFRPPESPAKKKSASAPCQLAPLALYGSHQQGNGARLTEEKLR